MNQETIKNYLLVLESYGVETIECRIFPDLNEVSHPVTKKFSTNRDELPTLYDFIRKYNLGKGTINSTFNVISKQSVAKNKVISDSDIESIRFIFVDIDSIKEEKKLSATRAEVNQARMTFDKVRQFLVENNLEEQMCIFSGNGFHIMLPVQMPNTNEYITLYKQFLKMLAYKFNTDTVKIDTSVANPSRLGKLVGTVAAKGEPSVERPHRVSKLIHVPKKVKFNSLESLKRALETHPNFKNQDIDTRKFHRVYMEGCASKWLDYYGLNYRFKKGDNGVSQIYVLDQCPLTEHSNNQNGASLIANGKQISFNCLHNSHQNKSIHDFAEQYPYPKEVIETTSDSIVNFRDLINGKEYVIDTFILNKNGLYQVAKEGKVRIASALFVEKVYIDYHSKKVKYYLRYYSNNQWTGIWIDADVLQVSRLRGLVAYGIEFKTRAEYEVSDFLTAQKIMIEPMYYHESIGWSLREGALVYSLDKTYNYKEDQPIESFLSPDSFYVLEKRGTYEEWRRNMKRIVGSGPMDIALGVSCVPFLIGYLNVNPELPKSINNLLINLKGKSSSGKTTMIDLISSMFGNPDAIKLSLNATSNALTKLASMNVGFPLILDELGTQRDLSLEPFIFQISSGIERLRLNADSELKKQVRFSTGVILTSEQPLDAYLEHTSGLFVRYLEFDEVNWTRSAEESDAIKQLSRTHYGHAMPELVEKLFFREKNYLSTKFSQAKEFFSRKISDESPFKDRIIDNISLVYTGAVIVKELLQLELNLVYIETELIKLFQKMLSLAHPPERNDFDRIVEILVTKSSHFLSKGSTSSYSNKYGRVAIVSNQLRINVFKNQFEQMITKEFNVKSAQPIIRELSSNGNLNTEKDRQTKRLKLDNQSVSTYELVLPMNLKGYFNLSEFSDYDVEKQPIISNF